MKNKIYLLTGLLVFVSFLSCNHHSISERDIDAKAHVFISQADSTVIQTFKTWSYGTRGQAQIWSKQNGDTFMYSILYLEENDTTIIILSDPTEFKKDFTSLSDFDTIRFWRFKFKEFDNKIQIQAIDTIGRDFVFEKIYELHSLFPDKNPFQYFKQLAELKDSLGIIGSSYTPRIGEFIQFYLSPEYVLTYLPDTTLFDNRYKAIWINEFSKGKTIDKVWNLRKLDNKLDNG